MFNVYLRIFAISFVIMGMYGCASSGVSVRGYVEDRARVDQDNSGNAGFLAGTPKEDQSSTNPTRKIYVVEVSKETKEPPIERNVSKDSGDETMRTQEPLSITKQAAATTPQVTMPSDDRIVIRKNDADFFTEYTVEKDDTLQKIAKKFYGAYSHWPKIYEANREVIKNPDFVKPGTVLKIPK